MCNNNNNGKRPGMKAASSNDITTVLTYVCNINMCMCVWQQQW